MMGLRVVGSANEWTLILRNGELAGLGIGLSTFRGYFDQVVKFPSRVNQVEFNCNVVTKEMQEVIIRGIIVWSIYREEKGPYTAYKTFGDSLAQKVPTAANENLVSQTSAIVRDVVAKFEIDKCINERESIRKSIKDKLHA